MLKQILSGLAASRHWCWLSCWPGQKTWGSRDFMLLLWYSDLGISTHLILLSEYFAVCNLLTMDRKKEVTPFVLIYIFVSRVFYFNCVNKYFLTGPGDIGWLVMTRELDCSHISHLSLSVTSHNIYRNIQTSTGDNLLLAAPRIYI